MTFRAGRSEFCLEWFVRLFGTVRTVALVGNGPSIAGANHGHAIDGADVVVRMNNFILGSPEATGVRTDVYATNLQQQRPIDDLARYGTRAVVGARPDSVAHGFNVALPHLRRSRSHYETAFPLALVSEGCFDRLYGLLGLSIGARDGRNPSTGLVMAAIMLWHISDVEIACYGYDFFADSNRLHYFPDSLYNTPTAVDRVRRYHDPVLEQTVLRDFERSSNGRLVVATSDGGNLARDH